MPGPFGLTSSGFIIEPLDQILSDIEQVELSGISPSLNVQAEEPIGVVNGIVAQKIFELWQLAAALYNGMDPDQAVGDQLASLALLTGTKRDPATETVVFGCTVNVNAGFSQAPGTMFASVTGNPSVLYTNEETVASVGGGNVTVDFKATTAGPNQALAGTLIVIAVPITGWNSITNPNDGVVGSNIEADPALRIRRDEELQASGSDTADSIRSLIFRDLQPDGPPPFTTSSATVAATVLHNDTDTTDSNGLPPHSIEAIVYQPGNTSADDIAFATLLSQNKAAGINTHSGNGTSKPIVDSQGTTENIFYTRPTAVRLFVDITLTTDPITFPSNGAALVKNALHVYANGGVDNGGLVQQGHYNPGSEVFVLALQAQAFTVPGVLDVTAFKVDTVFPPLNTANLPIDIRHVATLATADIRVF